MKDSVQYSYSSPSAEKTIFGAPDPALLALLNSNDLLLFTARASTSINTSLVRSGVPLHLITSLHRGKFKNTAFISSATADGILRQRGGGLVGNTWSTMSPALNYYIPHS